jgi:hypothetical protein
MNCPACLQEVEREAFIRHADVCHVIQGQREERARVISQIDKYAKQARAIELSRGFLYEDFCDLITEMQRAIYDGDD